MKLEQVDYVTFEGVVTALYFVVELQHDWKKTSACRVILYGKLEALDVVLCYLWFHITWAGHWDLRILYGLLNSYILKVFTGYVLASQPWVCFDDGIQFLFFSHLNWLLKPSVWLEIQKFNIPESMEQMRVHFCLRCFGE
jgi:hypothetical protein